MNLDLTGFDGIVFLVVCGAVVDNIVVCIELGLIMSYGTRCRWLKKAGGLGDSARCSRESKNWRQIVRGKIDFGNTTPRCECNGVNIKPVSLYLSIIISFPLNGRPIFLGNTALLNLQLVCANNIKILDLLMTSSSMQENVLDLLQSSSDSPVKVNIQAMQHMERLENELFISDGPER